MTTEETIIAIVRIAGALPVLRWALAGSIIAILVDLSDLFMMNLIQAGGIRDYQEFDKWLDLSYMATFAMVAARWQGPPRQIALGLLVFRLIGVGLFEIVGNRWILFGFPNLFEFWFVFVAAIYRFRPSYELTMTRSLLWLLPLLALKEAQEYVLHGGRYLDRYVAIELVRDWWRWLTRPFR